MNWIHMELGDYWDDFPEHKNRKKLQGFHPSTMRLLSAGALLRQLRRLSGSGNSALLEELLREGGEGGCVWTEKALRTVLRHAADAATVAAVARVHPDFFHSPEGAPAAFYFALRKNNPRPVRALLEASTLLHYTPQRLLSGMNLVHAACAWNSSSCLSELLKAGAEVDCVIDGIQPLHLAAHLGHEECVKVLVAAGANPEAVDSRGWVPLHHAAFRGWFKSVTALLDVGASVNVVGPKKQTPLHLVVGGVLGSPNIAVYFKLRGKRKSDYCKCCEILLQRGADEYAVDEENNTPLQISLYHHLGRLTTSFVEGDYDLRQYCEKGFTAMHAFARSEISAKEKLLQKMVKKGLDINASSNNGVTPLWVAVALENTEAIKALLQHGADISICDVNGNTPLHLAAGMDYVEAVQIMLDTGVDMNLRNDKGETPLHKSFNSPSIIKALVFAGADIEAQNDLGQTPFHYCITECCLDSLDVFEEFGADLEATDYRGWTAMHMAVDAGSVGCMRWLAKRAAANLDLWKTVGVGARTPYDITPLHLAAGHGDLLAVAWLLRHGAPSAAVDADGRTPLHTAARGSCPATIQMLLESARGCDRIRTMRDIHGATPADLASEMPGLELQMILRRWCVGA